MPLDPRTPVLVGVGQLTRHPLTVDEVWSPLEMMAETSRRAGDDAGGGVLDRVDTVEVVEVMVWRPPNPALAVAEELGLSPRTTVRSAVGGNSPQQLVNDAAVEIAQGRSDVVLITGCEAVHGRRLAHKAGVRVAWDNQAPDTPGADRVIGSDKPGASDYEIAHNLAIPIQVYPVFENALRIAAGETFDDHQRRVSELWARFSEVATRNPHAWDRQPHTAEEIRTVTPQNRMVGWPYPKLMNSNIQVDMAASLLLTSVETARAAGVPEDRWVFPWAGADSHDHWFVSNRNDLCSSPAIAANGRAALGHAGIGIDDVAHVDLYSCFPSAVQMGAAALGLATDDPGRPLTVTGGLAFGGGPGNNYVTCSIATMAEVLRRDPGSIGVTTALGWFATKHSLGVWSTEPPKQPFHAAQPQDEVDAGPHRETAPEHEGPVTVESWTVMHERDGNPSSATVACLTADGRRCWGDVAQPDSLGALLHDDPAGAAAIMRAGGALDLS